MSELIKRDVIFNFKLLLIFALILLMITPCVFSQAATSILTKTHSPDKSSYQPGDMLQYFVGIIVLDEITSSAIILTDLSIEDTLPEGLTYVPNSQGSGPPAETFTNTSGKLTWDFGEGPFAGSAFIYFNVTVDLDIDENVLLTNWANVSYIDQQTGELSEPGIPDTIRITYPILSINKTSTEVIHEGETIEYNITVTNTGHFDAIGVNITDILPVGVNYTSGTAYATNGFFDESSLPTSLIWKGNIGNVEGLNTVNITIPVQDNVTIIDNNHTNTVNITGYPFYTEIIKGEDNSTTKIIHPDISLIKSVNTTIIHSGDTVQYTYHVTNTGDTPLYNVSIYDITWDSLLVGPVDLEPGEPLIVDMKKIVFDTTTNIANASGVDLLQKEIIDFAEANVNVIKPNISLTKSVNATVILPGEKVEYSYNCTNTGDTTLFNVTIYDETLMEEIENATELATGESLIGKYEIALWEDTVNTAVCMGNDTLGQMVTDTDEAMVNISKPSIELTKSVDKSIVYSGYTVEYTFIAENTGLSQLLDVTIWDETFNIPVAGPATLDPGDTLIVSLNYPIEVDTVNIANATGYDEKGNIASDTASVEVDVINPALTLIKDYELSKIDEPADITYNYTVINIGDTKLYNVNIYDMTLDLKIIGPVDIEPLEVLSSTFVLENQLAGTYYNMANVTALDILGGFIIDYDPAECTILEESISPLEVGGEIIPAIKDEIRVAVIALITIFFLVFDKEFI